MSIKLSLDDDPFGYLEQGDETPYVATSVQVGGTHYTKYAIQPIEFCQRNGLSACQSESIAHLVRHKDKAGAEDLHKAIHYLTLELHYEYPDAADTWKRVEK